MAREGTAEKGRSRRDRERLDQKGATTILLVAGMTMFLGATAMAVDLGMLATARTEAQRSADAAALAGASSLVFLPGDAKNARAWAQDYARRNPVRGQPIALRDSDVEVVGDTVRVRVLRTSRHGGPVRTNFARIFGIDAVDISAVAAAAASPQVARVNCLLPLTLADRWVDFGTPEWNPSEGDYYEPPYRPDGSLNPNYSGYGQVGELITLSPSQGGSLDGGSSGKGGLGGLSLPVSSRVMPSVYNLWLPDGVHGASELRDRIMGCMEDDPAYEPGDPMWREAGNVQSLAREFSELLNDPKYAGQYYDAGCTCVRDANNGHEVVTGGLRLRSIPVHDITTFKKVGSGPHFNVSHFVGVFIDSMDSGPIGQANVYARIMPAMGLSGSSSAATPAGPLIRTVRLVQ